MIAKMKKTASDLSRVFKLPRCLVVLSAAVTVALVTTPTHAQIFDWAFTLGDPVQDGVIPLPLLTNDSGAELAAFLAGQDVAAVKVTSPLNDATIAEFLDGPTPLSHIFADFEPNSGGGALGLIQTEQLVFQTNGTASSDAAIGQFNLDPVSSAVGYAFTEVNTASPNLYPGSPGLGSFSNAQTIRSQLFTKPITRLSGVAAATPDDNSVLPYVTRFNITNSELVNSEYEGDPAFDTEDQLLSRGDYQALIAHYRMRDADGIVTFIPGVVGYTQEEFLEDSTDGWNFLDQIYEGEVESVSLDTVLDQTTGPDQSFEEAGAAWSGVVGQTASGKDILSILLSNLSDDELEIELPDELAGHDLVEQEFTIGSNDHILLAFALLGGDEWLLLNDGEVFADDERGGIGIPEPASLVMLGMGCLLIGLPRSRRSA